MIIYAERESELWKTENLSASTLQICNTFDQEIGVMVLLFFSPNR